MRRKPFRRHDSGRMIHARLGVVVNVSSALMRNMPSWTITGHSASGTDGRTSLSTRSTSAEVPTGRTVVNWSLFASVALRPLMRLMRISHQPAGRHRIGWVISTAWMRPGGTISVTVVSSPKVIRTPSGVGAIE